MVMEKEISAKELKNILSTTLKEVAQNTATKNIKERAKEWVERLAINLVKFYSVDNVISFSKYNFSHRKDFKLNELLYDIAVCQIEKEQSANTKHDLWYISDVLWEVESELQEEDSAQIVKDFNKLVLGSAPNKLLIAAIPKNVEAYIRVLTPIANSCVRIHPGNVFIVFVAHPKQWQTIPLELKAYNLESNRMILF
jgi:hypothetical protein